MRYVYQGYSDKGGRIENEDCYVCAKTKHGYLFLVADGLGGCGKGEIASMLVCEEILRQFNTVEKFDINQAVIDANSLLLARQKEFGTKMKTTLVAAWIRKDITLFVHVGDSRIYAFNRSGIIFQTEDHSAAWISRQASLVKEDVRNMEDRNVLTRALGMSDEIQIEQQKLKNSQYESFLLCSDGFWEFVLEKEMVESRKKWQTPRKWLDKMRLVLQSRISNDNDNNTAIAVMKRRI